jgi:V8-like Glu-specific endopeptidase
MRIFNKWMRIWIYLLISSTALLGAHFAFAGKQDEGVISSPMQDKVATLQYWTEERMKDAEHDENDEDDQTPASPPITPGGDAEGHAESPQPYSQNFISKVTGELFFYDAVTATNRHCTAAVLQSTSKRLLIAAAHCVMTPTQSPPMRWNEYLMFVPGYDGNRPITDQQRAPYGLWPVTRSYVSATLAERPELVIRDDLDLAIAGSFDQLSERMEDAVGGGFTPYISDSGQLFPMVNLLGYPAKGRYNGATQYWCLSSTTQQSPGSRGITLPNCTHRHGHSGGPILLTDHADQPWGARRIVAVVHSASQTRLLPTLYPYLEEKANSDHQQ